MKKGKQRRNAAGLLLVFLLLAVSWSAEARADGSGKETEAKKADDIESDEADESIENAKADQSETDSTETDSTETDSTETDSTETDSAETDSTNTDVTETDDTKTNEVKTEQSEQDKEEKDTETDTEEKIDKTDKTEKIKTDKNNKEMSVQAGDTTAAEFTVTIPASASVNDGSMTISASCIALDGKTLDVSVASANAFKLVNENSREIPYTLAAGDTVLTSGGKAASFSEDGNLSRTFIFQLESDAAAAGTYTDTLTFTAVMTGGEKPS